MTIQIRQKNLQQNLRQTSLKKLRNLSKITRYYLFFYFFDA